MKIEKINGKYVQKRITPESKVPLLLWLSIVLVLASGVIFVGLKTSQIISGPLPELTLARKHSYKVIAVGDIACSPDEANYNDGAGLVNACQQKAVGKAVEKEQADAVLLLGDIQYTAGLLTDFNRSFVPYWRGVTAPIYAVPGNHDYGNATRDPSLEGYNQTFKTYFPNATYTKEGKSYYDFNIAEWQFYALDSNCDYVGGCGVGSDQLNWLTSKVTASSAKCSIAMWHHPVFTSGQHNALPDITYGKEFWRTLQDSGTDIILNGHDHDYERFVPQTIDGVTSEKGMQEFVSGTGGYSLRESKEPYAANSAVRINDQFGYLVLDLFPSHYTWQFKDIDGSTLDSGSGDCH